VSFYKAVAVFVRAFAAIAQDLTEAGYSDAEAAAMQKDVENAVKTIRRKQYAAKK